MQPSNHSNIYLFILFFWERPYGPAYIEGQNGNFSLLYVLNVSLVSSDTCILFDHFQAELAECLERDGFKSVQEAVGADFKWASWDFKIVWFPQAADFFSTAMLTHFIGMLI